MTYVSTPFRSSDYLDSDSGMAIVSTLAATGFNGQLVFSLADSTPYIYINGWRVLTSGGSSAASNWVPDAPLSGTIDGVNKVFTVPDNFASNTLQVFINGIRNYDVTATGANQITFLDAPFIGASLHGYYQKDITAVVPASTSTYGAGNYGAAVYA